MVPNMVSTQVTQDGNTPHPRPADGDSVRITAADRRQVLREHYEDEHRKQAALAAFDANELAQLRKLGRPYEAAKNRASNSSAVLQRIAANLAAYSDNRDFRGVAR